MHYEITKACFYIDKRSSGGNKDEGPFSVMINPSEISLSLRKTYLPEQKAQIAATRWGDVDGENKKIRISPQGPLKKSMSMELIFDLVELYEYVKLKNAGGEFINENFVEELDVSNKKIDLGEIYITNPKLCCYNELSNLVSKAYPVRFTWGSNIDITGTISDLSSTVDYFSPDGQPLRVRVDISIEEDINQANDNKDTQISAKTAPPPAKGGPNRDPLNDNIKFDAGIQTDNSKISNGTDKNIQTNNVPKKEQRIEQDRGVDAIEPGPGLDPPKPVPNPKTPVTDNKKNDKPKKQNEEEPNKLGYFQSMIAPDAARDGRKYEEIQQNQRKLQQQINKIIAKDENELKELEKKSVRTTQEQIKERLEKLKEKTMKIRQKSDSKDNQNSKNQ